MPWRTCSLYLLPREFSAKCDLCDIYWRLEMGLLKDTSDVVNSILKWTQSYVEKRREGSRPPCNLKCIQWSTLMGLLVLGENCTTFIWKWNFFRFLERFWLWSVMHFAYGHSHMKTKCLLSNKILVDTSSTWFDQICFLSQTFRLTLWNVIHYFLH